jgi:hypothetical protein
MYNAQAAAASASAAASTKKAATASTIVGAAATGASIGGAVGGLPGALIGGAAGLFVGGVTSLFFDTGGYTGDAPEDKDGGLAVLHTKELVLNQEDTSNILDAVETVRSLQTTGGLGSTVGSAIASRVADLVIASTGTTTADASKEVTVKQEVTIEANFPNATDKSTITSAIGNLVNIAAQRAWSDLF